MRRQQQQPASAAGQPPTVSAAFVQAAQTMLEMQRNAEEHNRLAAASGNTSWQRYRQAAEAEPQDRTSLGRPIPLLLLGFGAAAGRRSLATELIRQIIASRQLISHEFGVYFPVLGIADHAGSFSPHQPMPYAFAIQAGLSDAGMMQVAVDQAEEGISLRGNGHANTKEVVENAGQRGCVVLDLADDKKTQLKSLPGLLLGGEKGYYAVVVGKRSEGASAAITRAYPADRLLRLSAADLDTAAAEAAQAASSSATSPLQRKALGLLRRMAAWYCERPQVQQEAAQAEAAQQRFGSRPERRKAAERMAAELAAAPGQPLCPCGCGQAEVEDHMAGILTVAMADPAGALAKFERGDHQMAFALGNLLGLAVGPDPSKQVPQALEQHGGQRLLDAIVAQMAAARQRSDYHMWRGTVLLASNASRFQGEAGNRYRRRLLEQGLVEELLVAQGSKDVHTRDAARQAAAGLEALGAWQRQCFHCRRAEPAGAEGPGHLLVCAGCKSRVFCGKECLQAAWPAHKRECKQLAAL